MTKLRSFPFWTALVCALIAAATSVTCVSENTEDCGNGLVCPQGTRCAAEDTVCIRDECGDGEGAFHELGSPERRP